jgi:peptide/nickel transport system ATP-binding protein
MSAAPREPAPAAPAAPPAPAALLELRDLRVRFDTADGVVHAVDGVSLAVAAGRTLAIVGESGSGKSVTCESVLGLSRAPRTSIGGEILFGGVDLAAASEDELRRLRGNRIAMIFQDPLSALHPYFTVADQLVEAVRAHRDVPKRVALACALELLGRVGIADAARRAAGYPHELSGGLRQRVMIAMALVNDPELLIADEPTTALDVTVQAQILELLGELQRERAMAIVLVSHDLGVVAELAHDVAVMYAGRIVEQAPVRALLAAPEHPYTWGLLQSIPRLERPRGEELVAIAGRPPSLVDRPSGCHFHPRCEFVRDAHRYTRPELAAPADDPAHPTACLLAPRTRRALWVALRHGATAQQARAAVPGTDDPPPTRRDAPAAAEEPPSAAGR